MNLLWQSDFENKILDILKRFSFVEAVVLKGSCTNESIKIDRWSDIDLWIVTSDRHMTKLFPSVDWLLPLGNLFALEQHATGESRVSRICFDDFVRFDLTFVEKSDLKKIVKTEESLFGEKHRVLYSKIKGIEKTVSKSLAKKVFQKPKEDSFNTFANGFWFLAVSAISKVIRGDFLIGSHLALEMAQNCVVLQMMLRDLRKGTNIHRTGDFEKVDILNKIGDLHDLKSPQNIFSIIKESGKLFDKLASKYDKKYKTRYDVLKKWLVEAEKDLAILSKKK